MLASQARMRQLYAGPQPRVLFVQWRTWTDVFLLVHSDFYERHGAFLAFDELSRLLNDVSAVAKSTLRTSVEGIHKQYLGQVLEWKADILVAR